ncbi:hypothetical protein F5051DRAFT_122883 [Lentinula edodes]|nr:hypothetical protein F5051DRAFT_122883 [Lentinula edodes]
MVWINGGPGCPTFDGMMELGWMARAGARAVGKSIRRWFMVSTRCVSGGLNLTYVAIDRPAGNGFSRSQARTTIHTRYNRQGGVEFVKGCHAHSVDSWSSEQWLELSDFCKIFPEYKCTMYDRHTSTNQRP